MRIFSASRKSSLIVLFLSLFSFSHAQATDSGESNLWRSSVLVTLGLVAITNPLKARSVSFELGGNEHFDVSRLSAQWDWNDDLLKVFGWKLSSYWQLDFSKWQSTNDATQEGANVTVGLTPMFRFTGRPGYVRPYVDIGVGAYLFTDSSLEDHEFGSNFQFSDMLSIGANVGKHNQWGIAYKFQHYSNGSVKAPNNGINFYLLTLTYNY